MTVLLPHRTIETCVRAASHLDPSALAKLLDEWIHGDETKQQETFEVLRRCLEEDRPEGYKTLGSCFIGGLPTGNIITEKNGRLRPACGASARGNNSTSWNATPMQVI